MYISDVILALFIGGSIAVYFRVVILICQLILDVLIYVAGLSHVILASLRLLALFYIVCRMSYFCVVQVFTLLHCGSLLLGSFHTSTRHISYDVRNEISFL